MSISADNDRLTIIIPKVLKGELKSLADNENRSISNYVVKVLQEHVMQENNRGLQRDTQRQMNLRKSIRDEQRVAEDTSNYNNES